MVLVVVECPLDGMVLELLRGHRRHATGRGSASLGGVVHDRLVCPHGAAKCLLLLFWVAHDGQVLVAKVMAHPAPSMFSYS